MLRRLKPDALLVSKSKSRCKATTRIQIVEVKCCIDTKPRDQLQKAREQHQVLIDKLVAENYLRANITIIPILIGASGTIYKKHTMQAIMKLGVAHTQAKSCISKLHKEAIRSLHSIVRTRRFLEHSSNPPKPP